MKRNISILAGILLVLSMLVFFAGCPQPGGNTQSGGFTLNAQQEVVYNNFITSLATTAATMEIPATTVKSILDASNVSANALNFKIVDSKPDTVVAQNSTAENLKKRFKPAKI